MFESNFNFKKICYERLLFNLPYVFVLLAERSEQKGNGASAKETEARRNAPAEPTGGQSKEVGAREHMHDYFLSLFHATSSHTMSYHMSSLAMLYHTIAHCATRCHNTIAIHFFLFKNYHSLYYNLFRSTLVS